MKKLLLLAFLMLLIPLALADSKIIIPNDYCENTTLYHANESNTSQFSLENVTICGESSKINISLSCPQLTCPTIDYAQMPKPECNMQCPNITIPECKEPIVNVPDNLEFGWRTSIFIIAMILLVLLALFGWIKYIQIKKDENEVKIKDLEPIKQSRLEDIEKKKKAILEALQFGKIGNREAFIELDKLKLEEINIRGEKSE